MADAVAWLFPGQGSQAVGMGKDLAARYPVAAEVYAIADQTLGFPVSTLCWEGPAEELTRTANQQPALLATSIAMQRVLAERGQIDRPAFIAGHSLGEYSALVAAGALDLADALRLVRRRGELMEEHGLGGMIALIGM
ncbi:MAG TPA: acyltransferase domain-containing protein, partial [Thermomicrobiales bacterium]|nr:acyltransferase domain-containing protein [Thermomicrobiales bacterium]